MQIPTHVGSDSAVGRRTYAVLVDAENVNWRTMGPIMAKISKFGDARIRRMYGDFAAPGLSRWAEVERNHSFMMVHQGALVKGKGCSDVLMAADAIELRYENDKIDGFCIVSSDSDFAPLVKRLREAGKHVVGFGRAATPVPFQQACHVFVPTDRLGAEIHAEARAASARARARPQGAARQQVAAVPLRASVNQQAASQKVAEHDHVPAATQQLLFEVVNAAADESNGGWACLSAGFNARIWGPAGLADLLNSSRCSVLGGERRAPEFEARLLSTQTVVRIMPLGTPAVAAAAAEVAVAAAAAAAASDEAKAATAPAARIKRGRAEERRQLLTRHAASFPSHDALRSFYESYESLKTAYAARGGGTPSSELRLSAADAKVREALQLLQPQPVAARAKQQQHQQQRAKQPAAARASLGRTLHGWLSSVKVALLSVGRTLHGWLHRGALSLHRDYHDANCDEVLLVAGRASSMGP